MVGCYEVCKCVSVWAITSGYKNPLDVVCQLLFDCGEPSYQGGSSVRRWGKTDVKDPGRAGACLSFDRAIPGIQAPNRSSCFCHVVVVCLSVCSEKVERRCCRHGLIASMLVAARACEQNERTDETNESVIACQRCPRFVLRHDEWPQMHS